MVMCHYVILYTFSIVISFHYFNIFFLLFQTADVLSKHITVGT